MKIQEHDAPKAPLTPAIRHQAAMLREELAKERDAVAPKEWGRRVTIGDVAKFHRSRDKCSCRGDVEMTVYVKGVKTLHICAKAREELGKTCGWRIINTPDGPRWFAGVEPENFARWSIFAASMRQYAAEVRTRQLLDKVCASGGNGRWTLRSL